MKEDGLSRGAKDRVVRILAVAGILLVGVAGGFGLTRLLAPQPELVGTELEPPREAMDFTLTDHKGRAFRLSENRGRVVVLTFLYTSCTDVCPFMGVKLGRVYDDLGTDASQVEFVVITTDPERDRVDRIAQYSRDMGMSDTWHFLTGGEGELQAIWEAYLLRPSRGGRSEHVSDEVLREFGLFQGLSENEISRAKGAIDQFGGGYDVSHSTPVWLIDRNGQLRAFHGQDLLPSEMIHDIDILLKED